MIARRLRILAAFLRRDWLHETSYRLSFGMGMAGGFFSLVTFYFMSRMIGPDRIAALEPYGGDYFGFALVGIAFHGYLQTSLHSFGRHIREAQMMGTLEMLLVTPTSPGLIVVGSSLFSFAWTSLRVVLFVGMGLIFGLRLDPSGIPIALCTLLLTVLAFASLGLLSASFILVFKRGDPVLWLFSGTSTLLGGLYYPVSVLPDWLQKASHLLPITPALEAVRRALLVGEGWSELWPQLAVLAGFATFGLPIGVFVFQAAVRHARREGTLAQY